MLTHTQNSCSALNPSKVHTHSTEHTLLCVYAAAPREQFGNMFVQFLIDYSLSFGPHIQYLVRKFETGPFLESSIVCLLQQGRNW